LSRLGAARAAFAGLSSVLAKPLRIGGEFLAGAEAKAPGFGAAAGGGGLALGHELSDPIGRLFESRDPLGEQVEREALASLLSASHEAQVQQAEQEIASSLAHLAATRPDIYTSVAAGRRLPRGARVHGGQVRDDLLELIGQQMASSAPRQPAQDIGFLQG